MIINQTLLIITIFLICSCGKPNQNLSCDDLEKLEKLASENNIDAQTTLITCYQKAGDQGDAFAQTQLALIYDFGKGVDKDPSKAIELYLKAADQGNATALTNLGFIYTKGEGVDKDSLKAVEFFQKAADQGNASAQNALGFMYATGEGTNKDLSKAIELYRKAADQGNAAALTNLGFIYAKGEEVDKDSLKAIEFFQKAADQGDASAQNALGFMYETGEGINKDLFKAVKFYQKAADQGHELAKKNLQNKSLQFAIPFGLKIGFITLDEIKTKYKVTKKDNNKWTDKPMYQIEPISQIDFEGLQELILIFDEKEVLQALIEQFSKDKFYNLLRGLEEKYNSVYKEIPHVGDKEARFIAVNGIIILEAIHLESHTFLLFMTNEFESLKRNKMQAEKLLKKQKEESML